MKTTDELLQSFDTDYDIMSLFGGKVKDFTPLINALESILNHMKITREVCEEVKKEMGEYDEKTFTRLAAEKLAARVKGLEEERMEADDMFATFLFKLPDRKGRIFFELTKRIEEAGKLPIKDRSKKEKVDSIMHDLEAYIKEIREISRPFIHAPVDKKQTIIFKVMFKYRKGTWRKIEMKASQTLKDLHDAIQDAIGWDNDHLYSFFMDNKYYSKDHDAEFTCPYEPEGRRTADIAAGAFAFEKGRKFAYLFDFGDDHRFEIEVLDFGAVEKGKKYPFLMDSKGKSPEQYRDF